MQQQPVTVSVMKDDGVGIAEDTGDMIAEIFGTDSDNAHAVFYLSNHRGDTPATYRGSSTQVARYRYDAFGNQRTTYCVVDEPDNAPRYTFSTKAYLSDAKLYLYAYRVYDPQAGRWTQRDPIDYQDSANLYQFCGNNPVNVLDVDGRIEFYGNWGGPDWTGGQTRPYESLTPGQQAVLIARNDSMDDLFLTHDLAYSAARVTERNAIDAATKARNEALKNASSPEQVAIANTISTKAIREAQSQCRRVLNQADDNLLQGLSQLDSDPSRWGSSGISVGKSRGQQQRTRNPTPHATHDQHCKRRAHGGLALVRRSGPPFPANGGRGGRSSAGGFRAPRLPHHTPNLYLRPTSRPMALFHSFHTQ
jgi:RHS repeat-associated protein